MVKETICKIFEKDNREKISFGLKLLSVFSLITLVVVRCDYKYKINSRFMIPEYYFKNPFFDKELNSLIEILCITALFSTLKILEVKNGKMVFVEKNKVNEEKTNIEQKKKIEDIKFMFKTSVIVVTVMCFMWNKLFNGPLNIKSFDIIYINEQLWGRFPEVIITQKIKRE